MALIGMTSTAATATRPKPRRRSRAKARPPRSYAVICAELRGLGGLVLEQALLDGTEAPLASLCEWADRLALSSGSWASVSPRITAGCCTPSSR